MRMLVSLFTMVMTTMLSTTVLASIATRANTAQQLKSSNQLPSPFVNPPTTAKFADAEPAEPAETVLLPDSQILAGNPDKNEFFIVAKDQPTPPELIAEQKLAEERAQPTQIAIDETKKKMQEMKVPKLEKALGESAHKVDTQAQVSNVVMNALKQTPETAQAENDVNPQLGSMIAAPVLSDATNAPVEPKKAEPVADAIKTPVKPVKIIKPIKPQAKKKLPIKHVFNAKQSAPQTIVSKKPVVVASESKPVVKSKKPINVKALLAKVEVVKPNLKPTVKKQASAAAKQKTLSANKVAASTKPKTVSAKKAAPKPVASAAKKVHLTLSKTKQEVKHGNTSFKVKSVTAE